MDLSLNISTSDKATKITVSYDFFFHFLEQSLTFLFQLLLFSAESFTAKEKESEF